MNYWNSRTGYKKWGFHAEDHTSTAKAPWGERKDEIAFSLFDYFIHQKTETILKAEKKYAGASVSSGIMCFFLRNQNCFFMDARRSLKQSIINPASRL